MQPYPSFDKRWLISNDGGNEPTWRGDGKELFYRNGYKMMVVSIQAEPDSFFEKNGTGTMIGKSILPYKIIEKLGEGGSPREITKRQYCGSVDTISLAWENEGVQELLISWGKWASK